jgi:hypothetical protein
MTHNTLLIPVLTFVRRIAASPTPAFSPLNTSSLAEDSFTSSACSNIYNCRTPWGVIYGCIITIFACTYVSFHSDVPDRTYTLWRIRVTHICYVLVGFLVPELMVARAALQWRWVRKNKPAFQGMLWNPRGILEPTTRSYQRMDSNSLVSCGYGWFPRMA